MSTMIRLDRLLVARGVSSRQLAKKLARRGALVVDGEVVRNGSTKVREDAVLLVEGAPHPPMPLLLAFHKPEGMHSTMHDPVGRLSLAGCLPERWRAFFHPVGRLDAETTGLLLFSRDGQATQHLLHPRRAIEREYVATVEPTPTPALVGVLAAGVKTSEGIFIGRIESIEGDDVRIIVTEGKHRMVRRMLNNAGHPVLALRRIRYGAVELGDLEAGKVRAVSAESCAAMGLS